MLTKFIQYLTVERRYSPLTIRNYRRDLENFLEWLEVDQTCFAPAKIEASDIREWIIHRTEQAKLGAGSMNRELSSVRSFFRWLHRTGCTTHDVAQGVGSLRTPRRLPAFVPESRMITLLDQCDTISDDFKSERDALIILIFYTCGIRLAELVGIDRADFNDTYDSLRIRGKGDKERLVPVLEFVREKILHYIALIDRQNICIYKEKALFLTQDGKRIPRSTVYRVVKAELQRAGVQGKQSPHVLRHTFATHLLNSGADMREIQELLGHASLQATQVYTHNSITALKEAYAKAHPREKAGSD